MFGGWKDLYGLFLVFVGGLDGVVVYFGGWVLESFFYIGCVVLVVFDGFGDGEEIDEGDGKFGELYGSGWWELECEE